VLRKLRPIGLLLAVFAFAALPAVSQAHHANHGKHKGAGRGKGHHSKCVIHPAYVVKGKLVSFTPDDPATTDTNEASVTLTVTGANKHARRSGVKKGDEVTFTAATDENGFKVKLSGYGSGESPKAGDKVRVVGKIDYTKKKCAPDKTREERYGDVNVRRVKIVQVKPG
jgi:hypothetical protein